MNSTRMAPTVAPISPAPWSGRYHPIAWPMKVEMNAPAMPSRAVRMNPDGLFGPGDHPGDDPGNETYDDDPDNAHLRLHGRL
jgi:hypothetical protein